MARVEILPNNLAVAHFAHIDFGAAWYDARADVNAPVDSLGGVYPYSVVDSRLGGAILQGGSIPGLLASAQRVMYGDNIFPFDLRHAWGRREEDHYAPGRGTYRKHFRAQAEYLQRNADENGVVTIYDARTMHQALISDASRYVTAEGGPLNGKGHESELAKMFEKAHVVQFGPSWNDKRQTTIAPHGKKKEEGFTGLTQEGKDQIRAVIEEGGVRIIDGAHAHTRAQWQLAEYVSGFNDVWFINSHTGLQISDPESSAQNDFSRNITPQLASAIMEFDGDQYGVVGYVPTKTMVGNRNATGPEDAAIMVEEMVWTDPTKGLHVVSGHDTCGVAPGSPVPGMELIHEAGIHIARAMQDRREAGLQGDNPISDATIRGIIGENGERFLTDVFIANAKRF